ncbi:MAG: response regulator transcription factor [Azospirillaceae bacterium]
MREGAVSTALVAGDQLLREGLKQLSEVIGLRTIAEAPTLAELIEAPEEGESPSLVILLDWPAANPEFQETIKRFRKRYPAARLVVLTESADPRPLLEALNAGVDGYLHRNMSSAALLHSIRLVMLGEAVFPGKLAVRLLGGEGRMPAAAPAGGNVSGLSPRETDILILLAEGQPNKVIANKLGTTEATVKVQLRRILRKIGVQNRTQAAIWALGHLGKAESPGTGTLQ